MGLLLLPLGMVAGWIAGVAMSRRIAREEVERLESRLAGAQLAPPRAGPEPVQPAPAPTLASAARPVEEEVSPDTVLILSAAVAAFLGKRARIRSARLVRTPTSSAWAQQGRVFVQASHNLGVVHGR